MLTSTTSGVLLVDDDDVDVMTVQRAFEKNRMTNPVHVAGNGVEALAKPSR